MQNDVRNTLGEISSAAYLEAPRIAIYSATSHGRLDHPSPGVRNSRRGRCSTRQHQLVATQSWSHQNGRSLLASARHQRAATPLSVSAKREENPRSTLLRMKTIQGYLTHNKQPRPLWPPCNPKCSPPEGSYERGCFL